MTGQDSLTQRLSALTPAQRELLERIMERRGAALEGKATGLGRRPDDGPVVTSYEQERLWFMHQLVGYQQIFHVPTALRLRGALDTAALQRALDRLVERHEALRTVFGDSGDGPRQIVRDKLETPLAVEDCTGAPDPEAEARRRGSASVAEPFDLEEGPLLRCALYRLGPDDNVLLITQHHIVSDYWSLGILLGDLGALYAAESGGPEPDLPDLDLHYPDFAHWQRTALDREAVAAHLEYWRDRLTDLPETLDLPTDRPRPALRASQGRFHHVEFPAEPVARLRDLARQESTTLLAAFLAVYAALLSRLTRQDTVVVGVPVAGRARPELQQMIGYFLNWLPIRIDVADRPSLRLLVRRCGAAVTEAMAHQDLPFDILVQELQAVRRPGVTPVFQTSFSLRDAAPRPPSLPGVEAGFFPLDGGATHFDLMAELWCEDDRVVGYLPYDDELFDAETVADHAVRLGRLLDAGTADPDRSVAALPLLDPAEHAALTGGPREQEPPSTTLHAAFAAQAARRPDAVAVSDETGRLTYAELDRRAEAVAAALREQGVAPGEIVGLLMDRTSDLVAALLGILKCGAAYLPVDPDSPPDRTAAQFADCAAAAVVTLGDLLHRLPEQRPAAVLMDRITPEAAGAAAEDVPATAPAYVIYTSGSTGAPKGVLVSHANALRLFRASAELFDLREDDVWTLFHSSAFDFSVWELWGALLHGGRLVVVPQWLTRAPDAFTELLADEGVTVLSQTPSAFGQLARVLLADGARPLPLRYVVFGGEALDHTALAAWVRAYGDEAPRLVNMYGITETTVHVTFRRVTAADTAQHRSLIGRPLPDLALYLLDDELQPVPPGVPGEIFVGGAGVALGYQNAPALTAARMLPDPFGSRPGARMYRAGDLAVRGRDGELAYLGRADDQHKIRGHRVELGEVQAALSALEEVAESAVRVVRDRVGAKALAAYAVPAPGRETTPTRIRRSLLRTLPDWMVPATVTLLDRLPLTRNGKLDHRALSAAAGRDRAAERTAPALPQGATANALAEIWIDLLGVSPIGADDDFFELGGHSLMVIQLVSRIRRRLGVEAPMESLFRRPTLQAMADLLDGGSGTVTEPDIDEVRTDLAVRLAALPRPPADLPAGPADTVLLTGATGFVGSFVLAELLARDDVRTVVCLVRNSGDRPEAVTGRLRSLGLWRPGDDERVQTIEGDLSAPRLGLAPDTHARLAATVGRILHVAAWVNHLYPYQRLEAANAHSPIALLELASTTVRKSLTAVSTSAVFNSDAYPQGCRIAAEPLIALPPSDNGYARSKAVAELVLEHAGRLGVPARVVRLPSIYGDREHHQINEADYIWSWSKAILATGGYPRSFDGDGHLMQALPADAAARAIVSAGLPTDPPGLRIVNAIPDHMCTTRDLLAGIRLAGHDPSARDDRDWYGDVADLDPARYWVAAIAGGLSRLDDPNVVRQRLHVYRAEDDPAVFDLVNARAIATPQDIAGYISALARLVRAADGKEGP